MNYLQRIAQRCVDTGKGDPFYIASTECPCDVLDDVLENVVQPDWCPLKTKEVSVSNALYCVPCWLQEVEPGND